MITEGAWIGLSGLCLLCSTAVEAEAGISEIDEMK